MPSFYNGLSGAGGGALAGGAIGGPAGAIIGGGLGLLGGLFGGSGEDPQVAEARKRLMALSGQDIGFERAGGSDVRGRQMGYLDQVSALSQGRGPSLAREMLRDSMERAKSAGTSAVASAVGRGVGPGGAYRNATNVMAAQQNQAARTGAMAGAAEQLGALSTLGGALQGVRGQDENLSMFNAGQFNDQQARQRAMRLQALGMIPGMNPKTGPSVGEQILAGGAGAYSMLGGRGGNRQAQQQTPGLVAEGWQQHGVPVGAGRYF